MSGGAGRKGWYGRFARLIEPFGRVADAPPGQLWPFVRWSLRGTFPALGAASLVSAFTGAIEVFAAMAIGYVVDAATRSSAMTVFAENAVLLLAIAAFFLVLRPLALGLTAAFTSITVGPNVAVLVQARLHRWTLGQAVTFFDNDFAGRIAQKQMQAARGLSEVVVETINTVVFAIATVLTTLAMVVGINLWLAPIFLVWLIGYYYFIRHFIPLIRRYSEQRASARTLVTGQVVDTITNMRTVKLFAHGAHEDEAATQALGRYRDSSLDFGYVSTTFRFYLMMIAGLLPVLLVTGALILWRQGSVTLGEIAGIGTIGLRISQMTGWVSFTLMGLYANLGEVEDGMNTLSKPYTLVDAPDALVLPPSDTIDFDHVTFAYGRATGGVRDLDLHIRAGEKIGIVGASGAGKSTLVALLLRLYDTEAGRVRVGGRDIREVTQDSLRRNIAMVTQETAMFNRTARDNILYGRPEATEDEVLLAAQRAEAHEFITKLRDHKGRQGYDAFLGERGVKLSGGQRQRIALARAMLKDAPILVLDEATSALDSEVEAAIQQALETAMEGKTVLAIAHRLSTLARMDRIIVLDHGKIVEEGSHAALLAKEGLYARYWNRQSGGFIGTDEEQDAAE